MMDIITPLDWAKPGTMQGEFKDQLPAFSISIDRVAIGKLFLAIVCIQMKWQHYNYTQMCS